MTDIHSFMSPTQLIGGLYIGDIQDVREGDTSKFDTVVGVCQDDCSENVGGDYEHFSLRDGPYDSYGRGEFKYELLSDAIDAVLSARIRRDTVLIHCHAGQSRSATVAIAAMAVLEGMTWDDAYNHAVDKRPIINPNMRLVDWGKQYVEEHQ